jgi:hypothetical protein
MKKIGSRTYEVTATDFPIQVKIRAKELNNCDAVPSDIHIARQGSLEQIVPVVVSKPDSITITYEIQNPDPDSECAMTQSIPCYFPDDCNDAACYEFVISAADGTTEKTTARVPTINPSFVTLAFLYKK